MTLYSYFTPLLAYVQALPRRSIVDPEDVFNQIQQIIGQARDSALTGEISVERFHQGLFPVVAWVDERLAMLPAWREKAAWRSYMLQRKLFHTSLAGVQFFEQMAEIDEKDNELREVYLTCLGLGFVGKYSQTPNSLELMQFKQAQHSLLLAQQSAQALGADSHLFSPAYQTVATASKHHRALGSGGRFALSILVPLAGLVGLAFWLDHELARSILDITEKLP